MKDAAAAGRYCCYAVVATFDTYYMKRARINIEPPPTPSNDSIGGSGGKRTKSTMSVFLLNPINLDY